MKLFHIIDDAQVILRSKGVFRQAPMYRRSEELFAKHGSGFIRLMSRGATSAPNVSWIDMDTSDSSVASNGGQFNSPRWVSPETNK